MLMTHYREPIDFSVSRLEEAEARLKKWQTFAGGRTHRTPSVAVVDRFIRGLSDDLDTNSAFKYLDQIVRGDDERKGHRAAVNKILRFIGVGGAISEATRVNRDVIKALSSVNRLSRNGWRDIFYTASAGMRFGSGALKPEVELIANMEALLNYYQAVRPSSFRLPDDVSREVVQVGSDSIEDAVERAIAARLAALNTKDFAKADAIRNELAEQGIALMDYKDEAGERQTKWEVKR
jgi:cysteinyl-tRNA synthetase